MTTNKPEALELARRTIRQLSNAERDQILEQYLSDGIAVDKARIAELEAALIGVREQPTTCVGCEGAPASGNSPCAVCGQKSMPDVATLVEALEEIVDPVRFMQERLKEGERLNGLIAVQLAEDASYLKYIAKTALAVYRKQGENQ